MKFVITKRKYQDKEKTKLTLRVPVPLITELRIIAEDNGWNVTDIILTVLDQFVQQVGNKDK